MSSDLKRNLLLGTVAGYAAVIVRMAVGLITFRLLYQGLSAEEFGFWSLLWAIMGFGIVVDFGFGYSVRKRVAEHSVREEWDELSEVLSSIFFTYVTAATLIFLVGAFFSSTLMHTFGVSPENRDEYRQVFLIFLGGTAILFPLGIFPEVLNGQQRLVAANTITILGALLNVTIVSTVLALDLGFRTLVACSLGVALFTSLTAAVLGLRRIPKVGIRPWYFSKKALLQTSKFSVFAYLNTLSGVFYAKTAQPAISTMFGVAQLTPYQAGAKVGEILAMLMQQLGRVLSPTAAHLYAVGDRKGLRKVLLSGMRFNALVGALLCVPSAAYMPGILRITTGLDHPTIPMIATGLIYVTIIYTRSLTHTVYRDVFMMAGGERRLMVLSVTETIFGLTTGIGAMYFMRGRLSPGLASTGMIMGPLLSSLLFGWGIVLRWVAKEAEISKTQVFSEVVVRTWAGALPMIALAFVFRFQGLWESGSTTFLTLAEGTIVGLVGIAGMWAFCLKPDEKSWVASIVAQRFKKPPVAAE